ncbi:DUF3078 domain-containing protein [Bernardetia sp.]|uniref:DUF3078 domain-containing protein n=1 Tax=Bernardetia sp. TaxID=1937974 RepID=UPI0025C25FCC|nr:DUF3078 domain-containing protein [Bernardetia sp.]
MRYINTLSIVFLLSLFICYSVSAQDTTNVTTDGIATVPVKKVEIWKKSGSISATFSNVGLSNWAGGGQSSIALGGIFNFNATRKTEKSSWENNLLVQYGMARVGKSDFNLFKKTDDNFQFDSKYNYNLGKNWSSGTSVSFRTQMAPGYFFDRDSLGKEQQGQLISNLLSPGYLLFATGIRYETKIFSMRYSPVAAKFTFVMNDSLANIGAFGVEEGQNIRSEFGSNFDANLTYDVMENVKLTSTLNLFANYETLTQIDVNWENLIVFKINKYLTTSFATQLIYDHDVLIPQDDEEAPKRAIQFKHVLNINVGYTF